MGGKKENQNGIFSVHGPEKSAFNMVEK